MGFDVRARADVGDLHARVGGALDPHEARVGLHRAPHLVQVAHVHVTHRDACGGCDAREEARGATWLGLEGRVGVRIKVRFRVWVRVGVGVRVG